MTTSLMLAVILAAFSTAHGTPARAVGPTLVIVEGRPGCTLHALDGDPTRPVTVCR